MEHMSACLMKKIRLGYPLRPDELMFMLEYAGWKE